ncbi:MAG: hypothetical protein FJ190_09250 [Gammaproteobacteria bacterium]|nr:hypothetical protein [Gammaproteobacteria bacterium]
MLPKVSLSAPYAIFFINSNPKKQNDIGRTDMGFILDLTETLKTPAGIIGLLVVIGAVVTLAKWVFAPHPDDEK